MIAHRPRCRFIWIIWELNQPIDVTFDLVAHVTSLSKGHHPLLSQKLPFAPFFTPSYLSFLSLQNWWTTNFLIYREAQKEIKTGKKEDQERPEKTDPDEDDMEEILQSKGNPLLMLIKAASIQNPKQFQLPAEVMTHAPLPGTLFFLMRNYFQPAFCVQSSDILRNL